MVRGQEEVVVPYAAPGPFSYSGDRACFSSELSPRSPAPSTMTSPTRSYRYSMLCVYTTNT